LGKVDKRDEKVYWAGAYWVPDKQLPVAVAQATTETLLAERNDGCKRNTHA